MAASDSLGKKYVQYQKHKAQNQCVKIVQNY